MSLADELAALLPPGTRLEFGELLLSRLDDGRFEARHRGGAVTGESLDTVPDLRELAKYNEAGVYRPLKTAPDLRSGWRTSTPCPKEFLRRLDALYPGAFAAWIAYRKGDVSSSPLRSTLDRQTGMYRLAGTISDEMAGRILEELCAPGCLRHIVWPYDAGGPERPPSALPGRLPLLCLEACTFAVSRARELAREQAKGTIPPSTSG